MDPIPAINIPTINNSIHGLNATPKIPKALNPYEISKMDLLPYLSYFAK